MLRFKECPPGKILNPRTNRCVKRDGDIGKSLIKQFNSLLIDDDLIHNRDIILNTPHIVNSINDYIDNTEGFNGFSNLNKQMRDLYQEEEYNQKMNMFTKVTIQYPDGRTITDPISTLYRYHVFTNKNILYRFSFKQKKNKYEDPIVFIRDIRDMRKKFVHYIQAPHKKLAVQFMRFVINSGKAKNIYNVESKHKLVGRQLKFPIWSTKIKHNYVELLFLYSDDHTDIWGHSFLNKVLDQHNIYHEKYKPNPYFILFTLQLLWYEIMDKYKCLKKSVIQYPREYTRHDTIKEPYYVTQYNIMLKPIISYVLSLQNIDTVLKNDINIMVQQIEKLAKDYKTTIYDIRHNYDTKEDDYYHHDDFDNETFFDQTLREINKNKNSN